MNPRQEIDWHASRHADGWAFRLERNNDMILPRRLRVAPLLLILLLIAGPLAAATHRSREVWQSRLSVARLLSEAWDLVSRIFGLAGSSIFPLAKEGGSGDPFGNPKPNSQPPSDSTSAAGQPASGS